MSDDQFYPTTVFGALLKDEDGWFVYQWPKTYEEVVEELKGNQDVLEVRKISQGLRRRRDNEDNSTTDMDMSEHMAFEFEWAFDPYSNRFRAPGELLKQPPVEPKQAKACKIKIAKPEYGWTTLKLRFDKDEASIRCSHVYDPFPEMIKWLEIISQGQPSRILINEEGCHTGISAYPAGQKHVRVVIHRYWEDLTVPIDHVVQIKTLVNNIYTEILKFVADKSLLYKKWAWDWRDEGEKYPSLESSTIENYLMEQVNQG